MQISANKKTLLLVLILSIGSAWAEWQETGRSVDAVIYIDLTTNRIDGNLRKVWTLIDYRERSKDGQMSSSLRYEFDCKEERERALSITNHSEAMAGGNVLMSHTYEKPPKWEDIPPTTGTAKILKLTCAK